MMAFFMIGAALLALLFYRFIVRYPQPNIRVDPQQLAGKAYEDIDFDELARTLTANMTAAEKRRQLYGERIWGMLKLGINLVFFKRFPHMFCAANKRLGIPPFVLSDGPRGARVSDGHAGATTFPVAMARGASWNVELEAKVHDVIGKEIRAIGANMAATPCINILRHPGWGRAQEVYGEDPFHMAALGVAATKAVQAHNVMASPKHYALNSIENSRFVVDVKIDERSLHEVYLPHFKKVVQDANAASLMTAYNKANGDYCSENAELIRIAREDWGFQGFFHSDWVFGMNQAHKAIQAGLNVEMPVQQVYSDKAIKRALENGDISESDIEQRVIESLRVRLDYAARPDDMDYPRSLLACEAHCELARQAAEESMVLLRNDQVLPFQRDATSIAVIGRLAEAENTGDRGSSNCSSPYVISPAEGIRRYHAGSDTKIRVNDGSDHEQARALAQSADQVVIVVGLGAEDEGEYVVASKTMERSAKAGKLVGKKGLGGDREQLTLSASDEALIAALKDSNRNTVVCIVAGSAIDMSAWHRDVPAILMSWYAGMEGGNALARILWGECSPSGKLPFAIPENAEDYPYFTPYTTEIEYGPLHGYTLFDDKGCAVAYPFGFGLSYSNFQISDISLSKTDVTLDQDETVSVSCQLSNLGDTEAAEVVQLYISFPESPVPRPKKLLKGFQKIKLPPGESTQVSIDVPIQELARFDPDGNKWIVDAGRYECLLGNSSAESDLQSLSFNLQTA